ncbi:YcxB family protein [Fusobacterium sp.]|uniref:YcxB family protein n=1 Tax=Fusobacterium sp. TaxID=68766 RepID=UPI002903669B|nr:YcxB family protein [Fusobacterium sp.]MDU1910935.1 YcxB family protein [Fusobacterium sp.]
MNILFENKYYNEKDLYVEYIKDVHCKYTRKLGYILLILGVFYSCLYIFKIRTIPILILAILLLAFSLRLITIHKIYQKHLKKNAFNLHNGKIYESIFQFTENKVILREGSILMEFDYIQIKNLKEYKLIYTLMIGEKQGLLLKKDSFSIGTFDEFKKFIVNKIKK